MHCMGYSTSDSLDRMGELERGLLEQMWQVLLQSNSSETHCTLGAIKRFLFIIEGLTVNDIDSGALVDKVPEEVVKDLQRLFSEFKPLFSNRLAKQGLSHRLSPRSSCQSGDPNLTFKPVLSPRNQEILDKRGGPQADPELRR